MSIINIVLFGLLAVFALLSLLMAFYSAKGKRIEWVAVHCTMILVCFMAMATMVLIVKLGE